MELAGELAASGQKKVELSWLDVKDSGRFRNLSSKSPRKVMGLLRVILSN